MREFATVEDVLDAVWGMVEFGGYEERPTVESIGIFGSTALFAPITWGDANAVRLLLEAGIDCNVQRERAETALHHAIRMSQFDIARMLLAYGANPNIKDVEGKACYDYCWEGEWDAIFGPNFIAGAQAST